MLAKNLTSKPGVTAPGRKSHRPLIWLTATLFLLGAGLPARADWQKVWSDEFDGTRLDPAHWAFDIGNGGPSIPGWGNNELEYYTSRPENVYVTNGLLHLVARKEAYNGFNYTSGRIKTAGLFSKKYGRFEFRAKLPQGLGYWPALWLMPQSNTYGGWAASGEIDVMEMKGNDPGTVLGTLHYGGSWPNNIYSKGPEFHFPANDSATNFHVYSLEWTNNAIRWYVDSQLYQTQTSWSSSGGPSPAPFDQPFYLIMNLAVGGKFVGTSDPATINANTTFPGEVLVDYVRVYEWVSTRVSVDRVNQGVRITWPTGSLESASDLGGPWTNLTVGSPYVISSIEGRQFFRVRLP